MTTRNFIVYEIVKCADCYGHGRIGGDVICPTCGGTGNVYSPVDLAEALKEFMVDVFGVGPGFADGYGVIVEKEPKE